MRLMRARAVKWISTSVGRQAFSISGSASHSPRPGRSLSFSRSPIIKFIHTPHAKSPKCVRARQLPASCAAFCLLATRFARSPSRARSRLSSLLLFLLLLLPVTARCQSYGEYSRCRRLKMYATFSRPRRPRYVNCKSSGSGLKRGRKNFQKF